MTHPTLPPEGNVTPLTDDVARLVRLADPPREIPTDRLRAMQGELRPLWQQQLERRSPWRSRAALAAGLVVLGLGALLMARWFLSEAPPFATVARLDGEATSWSSGSPESGEDLTRGSRVAVGRTLATTTVSRLALQTVSGHSLRLDRDSRIVLLSEAEIRLEQGAVYVDSGADAPLASGLTVHTPLGAVREIGTQFEVRLSADTLTVRVREGRVSVGSAGERHEGLAGEELELSAGRLTRRRVTPSDAAFDWTQQVAPACEVDGRPLAGFLAWAGRETGRRVEYEDAALEREAGEIRLSGELEGLTPEQAVDAVIATVGFTHRFEADRLLVYRSAMDRETPGN